MTSRNQKLRIAEWMEEIESILNSPDCATKEARFRQKAYELWGDATNPTVQ